MSHTLPLRWVSAGAAPPNASVLKAQARRGEWFAFQLGVHAALAPLRISALGGGMMGDGAAAAATSSTPAATTAATTTTPHRCLACDSSLCRIGSPWLR